MSRKVEAAFPGYSRGRNEWRKAIHRAVADTMRSAKVVFVEHDDLSVDVKLVMTETHFRFNDVDNRLKDVLDALQTRVGGPKAVRSLPTLIPNDKQVVRASVEKAQGANPGGHVTITAVN